MKERCVMKQLTTITFTLSLLMSGILSAQDIGKPAEIKPETPKMEEAKPTIPPLPTPPTPIKAPETQKPAELMKDLPAKPEEIKVKQTETQEIKVTPPTKPVTPAAFFKKAEEMQKNMQKFVGDAIEHAQANPADKEKVLEQLGIIMGMSIAGLEAVSGEKIIDFDALEAAEEGAKTTKQVERPSEIPAAPEAKKPTEQKLPEIAIKPEEKKAPEVKSETPEKSAMEKKTK